MSEQQKRMLRSRTGETKTVQVVQPEKQAEPVPNKSPKYASIMLEKLLEKDPHALENATHVGEGALDPIFMNDKRMLEDEFLTDDIDFENTESKEQPKTKRVDEVTKRKRQREHLSMRREAHEERVKISASKVEHVNVEAKNLARQVDKYIKFLRTTAQEVGDNPYLIKKLENMRKMCVGFISSIERQLPSYATSMFVQTEE
jgi:hypothetical protein